MAPSPPLPTAPTTPPLHSTSRMKRFCSGQARLSAFTFVVSRGAARDFEAQSVASRNSGTTFWCVFSKGLALLAEALPPLALNIRRASVSDKISIFKTVLKRIRNGGSRVWGAVAHPIVEFFRLPGH